jgi:8-amino-7-oxononanoate synthase
VPHLPIETFTATTALVEGREMIFFGGCNYLGLAHHPAVRAAVADTLGRTGLTTTASRETTGNTVAHDELEREMARFCGLESCTLLCEGYTANIALLAGLAPTHGVAIVDARAHRSLAHAAKAAGLRVAYYEHLDVSHALRLAREHASEGVAILTDSVFAANGDVAPLTELLAGLPETGTLVVDDCHGLCVLGSSGRGAVDHFGLRDERVVVTTTLAKGLGCYGGAVLGPARRIAEVRRHANIYLGTTPTPPPIIAGARAALRVLLESDALLNRLRMNIERARGVLSGLGLPLPPEGVPIFPIMLTSAERMERASRLLWEAGVLVPLIEYPGGPGPRYFRICVNAEHTPEQIERLGWALRSAVSVADAAAPLSRACSA